jgi:hypothetical protein
MFEIGPSLREARLRRGVSPEDVQKAIRIRERYLKALEEEQFELLPAQTYVKGFLRTYADYLGLDGSLYVDEFNARVSRHEEPAFVAEATAPVDTARMGVLRPLLAITAIVAAVAAVAAWQLHGSPSSPKAKATTTPPAAPTTPTTTPRTHAKKAATPKAAPLPTRAVLTAARGRVWLLVRTGDSSGNVLYEGTLEQGQTLPVKLAPQVWMRIGAPSNLDVRLGGRLLGGLPSQPANVLLGRRGLSPAA